MTPPPFFRPWRIKEPKNKVRRTFRKKWGFSKVDDSKVNLRKIFYLSYILRGDGNGTPLQYSCLENPMGGGAW